MHHYRENYAGSQKRTPPLPAEQIGRSILMLRGQRAILNAQLAALYGVATKELNQAVHRNAERFPADFMHPLTRTQTDALNPSQSDTGPQTHSDTQLALAPLNAH